MVRMTVKKNVFAIKKLCHAFFIIKLGKVSGFYKKIKLLNTKEQMSLRKNSTYQKYIIPDLLQAKQKPVTNNRYRRLISYAAYHLPHSIIFRCSLYKSILVRVVVVNVFWPCVMCTFLLTGR